MANPPPLLEFPTRFPIKAFGHDHPEFANTVFKLVQTHASDVTEADLKTSASRGGKYVAITITVTATSQAQLDSIYNALTAHEMVVMAL